MNDGLRANAETVMDTRSMGGKPSDRPVFGLTFWSPKKGILTLRDPSNHPTSIDLNAAKPTKLG